MDLETATELYEGSKVETKEYLNSLESEEGNLCELCEQGYIMDGQEGLQNQTPERQEPVTVTAGTGGSSPVSAKISGPLSKLGLGSAAPMYPYVCDSGKENPETECPLGERYDLMMRSGFSRAARSIKNGLSKSVTWIKDRVSDEIRRGISTGKQVYRRFTDMEKSQGHRSVLPEQQKDFPRNENGSAPGPTQDQSSQDVEEITTGRGR